MLQYAESTLNRWIGQSTAAGDVLRSLEGRSMRIDVENTGLRVMLKVEDRHVHVLSAGPREQADIHLCAGVFELIELLRTQSSSELRAGAVEFRGSVRVAEQFARMLQLARPQLEDELAGWIGGVPARAVAGGGQALAQWSRQAVRALELDTAEYLRWEARAVALPEDTAGFYRDVERLRDAVDRLEQRIAHLSRRLR